MRYKYFFLSVIAIIFVVAVFKIINEELSYPRITYLQNLEITDYSPLILIKGTYLNGDDINIIALDCYLDQNKCNETSVFITKEGITGIVSAKEYKIIERSLTRVVARYDGAAAFHMYTIDLAAKKVTFKNESNTNSSDVATYELTDGNKVLEQWSN